MDKLLSKKQVKEVVGFGISHIDRMVHEPEYAHFGFPKPVKIGFRVFFVDSEVSTWLASQIAKRDCS